ncbi:MAG: DUF1295 domain-containing protein [Chroococcidiopsidaceae cyanobacterium CP_BM_RX_35]|nr:DUF1295 domain-containing protein [Chroococcidiopsidaceae cyanobacterium CP_BM_RX_35]
MALRVKHVLNLNKGLTSLVVVGLMLVYQNFTLGPWIYLALHGTYGMLWLLKDRIYPDKQWEQEISFRQGIFIFGIAALYWVAPWLLVSSRTVASAPLLAIAISLNILGVFLHYVSDAQKYFTLKYHPGLITEGLFARCRNTNYLGEILIYLSFALIAQHWLPFLILAILGGVIFLPNMLKKDQSLSRYPGFVDYQAQSGLLLPRLFLPRSHKGTKLLAQKPE